MGQLSERPPLRNKEMAIYFRKTAGQKNVSHSALRDETKICLPPLHIKLGLIKLNVNEMEIER
jgi:hypothetical protein